MSGMKILLVEDEEDLVSAMVQRLKFRGIEASCALNGQQALGLIGKESFDVVVLDLKLPGMSGVEVHSTITKERPDLPIVLITGHGAPPDQLGLDPAGEYIILEKPVKLDILLATIDEVVKKK